MLNKCCHEIKNIYCQKGYEKCRIRVSTHNVASGFFFAITIGSVITGNIPNIFQLPVDNLLTSGVPLIVIKQIEKTYFIFIAALCAHLFRIYLSLQVIDKDPKFYESVLKYLENRKIVKIIEGYVRLAIVLCLGWFVTYRIKITATPQSINNSFLDYFFTPMLTLYLFLLIWDIIIFFFATKKRREDEERSRTDNSVTYLKKFFLNDLIGLFQVLPLVLLEAGVFELKIEYLIFVILFIGIGALYNIVTLAWDMLIKNLSTYYIFIKEVIFPFSPNIQCGENYCPVNPQNKSGDE